MQDLFREPEGLTPTQLSLIGELVDGALKKAAGAMERMLKIRIRAEHVVFRDGPLHHMTEFDLLGRFKVHLVKVSFKGEINGAFFFIINRHEVDLINKVSLPSGFHIDTRTEDKKMKHGFMSEIENMIASQSLEEISEFLGVQLIGAVPEISIFQGGEVNRYLQNENHTLGTSFHMSSVLRGVAVNISPYFIWMFDQKFIDLIRLNIVD